MPSETSRKDEILEVAELLFRSKGYRAISMDDVAEICGIQKESLFRHFVGKQELAIAVMAKVQAYFDRCVFNYAYDSTLSGKMRLVKISDAVMLYFSEDAGCLFGNFAIEKIDATQVFVDAIQCYFNSWASAYRAIFSCAYALDVASSLADDFVADLQGALIMMRVTNKNDPLIRLEVRLLDAFEAGSK
ncbi:TetR/AcrR family transcriptional regulator [Methylocapsa aurea]|uniref:TetR/AcrR family transcriptional regulator n=1 Tax=Methylocapsa aurea TaxID=663610 RepID=UPI0009FE8DFB|nr:TetR/AcrR family transcriptional regulator [Methylocapsa aurea]